MRHEAKHKALFLCVHLFRRKLQKEKTCLKYLRNSHIQVSKVREIDICTTVVHTYIRHDIFLQFHKL